MAATQAPVHSQGPDITGLRILVVDDVQDSREATRHMLEHLGAEVVAAEDGFDGLKSVERHHPDVVLCDLLMPRMDGFEFLQELRSHPEWADVRVIAITGLASRADHKRTEAVGFQGHLDKPFDASRLQAAVGAAISPP